MKKNENSEGFVDKSLFLCEISRCCGAVSKAVLSSRFVKFVKISGQKLIEGSSAFFAGLLKKTAKSKNPFSVLKRAVARTFAQSKAYKTYGNLKATAVNVPLRSFGVGLFFFGMYSSVLSAVKSYSAGINPLDNRGFIAGVICLSAAILCFFSAKPVIELLSESSGFSSVINEIMCLRIKAEGNGSLNRTRYTNICLVIGTVLGIMTLWISPLSILYTVGVCLFLLMLLRSPEFGINILLLLFPFLSETSLANLAMLSFVSYILKLVRGKRILHKGFLGMLPIALGLIAVIRHLISPATSPVDFSLIVSIPLVYITAFNIFSSRKLISGALDMISISFYLLIGARLLHCILEYLDIGGFAIGQSITSPSLIAEFTVLCMGFALYALSKPQRALRRIVLTLITAVASTLILSNSDPALTFCMIFAVAVFLIMSRSKSVILSVVFISIIPIAYGIYNNPLFDRIAGVLSSEQGRQIAIHGIDILNIYGIGGMILLFLFFFILVSGAISVYGEKEEIESERCAFAAVSSCLITFVLYCSLSSNGAHHASALCLAAVTAVAASICRRKLDTDAVVKEFEYTKENN